MQLQHAQSLEEVKHILQEKLKRISSQGLKLGLVVGKITPNKEGETLLGNKNNLFKYTEEIQKLVEKDGIVIFSSAIVPDRLESPEVIERFYEIFENIVTSHVKILYTTSGWEDSKGAVQEVNLAKAKGIPILHYNGGVLKQATI